MSCRGKCERAEQNLALASAFPNQRLDSTIWLLLKCSARDRLLAFSSPRTVSSANKGARYSLRSPAHTPRRGDGSFACAGWKGLILKAIPLL